MDGAYVLRINSKALEPPLSRCVLGAYATENYIV